MLFLSSCITPFLYAKARMPSIPALKESGGEFRKGEHSEFILTLAKEGRRVPGGLISPDLQLPGAGKASVVPLAARSHAPPMPPLAPYTGQLYNSAADTR